MRKLMLFLAVGLSTISWALAAPPGAGDPRAGRGDKVGARAKVMSAQTGYPVGINTPLKNNDLAVNPNQLPLIVIVLCNATATPKDLEGWVGRNAPATVQDMVASLSGTGRETITFVVPWDYWYHIRVAEQLPGGVQGGIPPGGSCKATAWWVGS